MSDLIDRQAKIEAIRKDVMTGGLNYEEAIESIRNNVMDGMNYESILKCLPSAQPEQKWIPVEEKLPEKYGWYQVTLKDGRVSRLYYDYKCDRWIDNVRKHMFELYDIYSKVTHKMITEDNEDVYWDDWVIAWQPLPKPYKEENR